MMKITLTNEMLKSIIEIEKNKVNLSNESLPITISDRLRKSSKKKSTYASNKIEGNPLTEKQVEDVINSTNRHFLKPERVWLLPYRVQFLKRLFSFYVTSVKVCTVCENSG